MKINKLVSLITCVGALCLSQNASAAVIENPNGVVPAQQNAPFGTIEPGLPANDANEVAFVNFLLEMDFIGTTTGTPSAPGGDPQTYTSFFNLNGSVSLADFNKTDGDEPGFSPIIDSGYEFVLGKYGRGLSVVWWLGGNAFTVPNNFTLSDGSTSGGLSHHSTFRATTTTRVPDGGMTLALLGLSLAGLGYMRRKLA